MAVPFLLSSHCSTEPTLLPTSLFPSCKAWMFSTPPHTDVSPRQRSRVGGVGTLQDTSQRPTPGETYPGISGSFMDRFFVTKGLTPRLEDAEILQTQPSNVLVHAKNVSDLEEKMHPKCIECGKYHDPLHECPKAESGAAPFLGAPELKTTFF